MKLAETHKKAIDIIANQIYEDVLRLLKAIHEEVLLHERNENYDGNHVYGIAGDDYELMGIGESIRTIYRLGNDLIIEVESRRSMEVWNYYLASEEVNILDKIHVLEVVENYYEQSKIKRRNG